MSLHDLRNKSSSELKKMNKDELINAIKDDAVDLVAEIKVIKSGQIETMKKLDALITKLDAIETDVRELKQDKALMSKELQDIKDENAELKEKLKQQGMVIKHHQTFMERIDMKERGCNLIITGIPEDREGGQNDVDKVQSILAELETNTDSDVKNIKRLGAREGQANNRPILVEMTSMQERNRIVVAARGNNAERLRGIRIKKDTHPSVRAEWRRLFEAKEAEEKKPGNARCQISFNLKKRQLLRDGQVIDSWCSQLF